MHRHTQTMTQYYLLMFLDHLAKLGNNTTVRSISPSRTTPHSRNPRYYQHTRTDLALERFHMASRLVPYLVVGDEFYLFSLLSLILFHKSYLALLPLSKFVEDPAKEADAMRVNLLRFFEKEVIHEKGT